MKKSRVVCFDLFNTLAKTTPSSDGSYENKLVELGAPRAEIYPFVRDCLMITDNTYEMMARKICEHFRLPHSERALKEIVACWRKENNSLSWIGGTIKNIVALRNNGVELALVTNCTAPAWRLIEQELSPNKYFDNLFVSCKLGWPKPSSEVWNKIDRWRDTTTHEMWMIGDNETDDLAVPRALGWNVHLAKPDGSTLNELWEKLKE